MAAPTQKPLSTIQNCCAKFQTDTSLRWYDVPTLVQRSYAGITVSAGMT